MSNIPVQVIVAAFQQEHEAEDAARNLKEARKEQVIAIEQAAVLRRDADGKLHIKDLKDGGIGKSAAIGGVVGAVLGLVAGPLLLAAGTGALIGGLAARLRASGFPEARLKELGEALTPGTSALVAIIDHTWVGDVQKRLEHYGAEVLTESIKEDIAQQLEAGHNVAYTAIRTDEGVTGGRVEAEDEQTFFTEKEPLIPPEELDLSAQSETYPG
jgi:uncharacterized membrane protein